MAAARMWVRRAPGGAARTASGRQSRRALYAALGLLVGLVLIGGSVLPQAGQTARAASGAATPTATPSSAAPAEDYALGQPMAHYMGKPDSWVWKATLPGTRLIVYFGIDGAPDGGVIGWYNQGGDGNDQCMINQLYAQAQQYGPVAEKPSHPGPPCPQASQELQPSYGGPADPTHPVMMGLDLTNPTIQPVNYSTGQCFEDCIARLSPDRMQHFADLAGQNHMLVWSDMEIGHSSVQKELAYYWQYLQSPWVEVALDPEWDFNTKPLTPGTMIGWPLYDTGWMYSSEINYTIDQLSALVLSKHLPPKILIVHEFRPCVEPNFPGCYGNPDFSQCGNGEWQHIHLKPGVIVVVNADGFGGIDGKTAIYNCFDNAQRIQYAGFKLFYSVNSLHDNPLMTPQQVLNLTPSPLLIMYA